jgi:transketolase
MILPDLPCNVTLVTDEAAAADASGVMLDSEAGRAVLAKATLFARRSMSPSTISPGEIRRVILEQSQRAHVGHIGCALSIADVIAALMSGPLRVSAAGARDRDRDRLILSKGHAALALYAGLHLAGVLTREELDTYCGDGTFLGVHPERNVTKGIDFSTGSLGQGLSMAAGAALAARLDGSPRRVFAVVSDGECNEGALWEAVMFAAHHRLASLTAIVDLNGQQAFGYTQEVINLSPMADRWRSFGWDVHEADGHDAPALARLLADLEGGEGSPHVVIARTVAGKGVSFMEGQIKWHYWPLSDDEYEEALRDIEVKP